MSFTQEVAQHVCDYFKDQFGLEITTEQLLRQNTWHDIVGYSWDANVYFKKQGWHRSMDEITDPEVDTTYCIVHENGVDRYRWENGRGFVDIGGMNKSMYK